MIYIVNIGGDFMGGRFFSAPVLCSAIVISKINFIWFRLRHTQIAIILTVIMLGLLSPKPTIFSTANYGFGPKIFKAFRFGPYIVNMYHGITDQRMWYYEFTGLLNNVFERNIYKYPLIQYAKKLRKSGQRVLTKDIIGMLGFYSGSNMHIIDPRALFDNTPSIIFALTVLLEDDIHIPIVVTSASTVRVIFFTLLLTMEQFAPFM